MSADSSVSIPERILTETVVPLDVACRFLGLPTQSDAGYRMAERYRRRMVKLRKACAVMDSAMVRPRQDASGQWVEIANVKIGGKIVCRTDMLRYMLHPEASA